MSIRIATVAILFHRLGPYHLARIEAAARHLPIVAIESSGVDKTYAWDKVAASGNFQRLTLFERADAQNLPAAEVFRRTADVLDQANPSVVVVPGWGDSFALGALRWCLQKRVPAVLMSESTAWDDPRKFWREAVKRQVVGLGSAALVGGAPHRDYMVQLGMPADRIYLGYDVVDNPYFAGQSDAARNHRPAVKLKHALPGHYFLASARFVGQKNLPGLLQAYARYRELAGSATLPNSETPVWDLVLLGDGTLRPDLVRLIASLRLEACVQMPGFIQYPDLPAYYGLAGAFIHASTKEPWGLVVNEAMASGLPVLVSNRCGCAPDLVQNGVNGYTFDPGNGEQVAQFMLKMSAADFPLSAFGLASRRISNEWGPDRFAAGLQAAVNQALMVGPPPARWLARGLLWTLQIR